MKKCWFAYNGYGKVTEVRIRRFYPERLDEKVVIRYDEQKNVAEKQIYQEGRLVYREIPAYDARGLRAGSAYYLAQDGSPDRRIAGPSVPQGGLPVLRSEPIAAGRRAGERRKIT